MLDNSESGDFDWDKETLEFVTYPKHDFEAETHDGHFHYESIEGYVGRDSFKYRICDDEGRCVVGRIVLTIIAD